MSASRSSSRPPVWVYPITAGGCGACAQSVAALQAPRYAAQLAASGIGFARSPRHADILLVTGPIASDSLDELRAYLESAPQPRALIAVGDCAITNGVFRGSPALVADPAEALDVNVEIGGCPPAPSAVLAALVDAAGLLAGATAASDEATEADEEADEEAEDAGDEEIVDIERDGEADDDVDAGEEGEQR